MVLTEQVLKLIYTQLTSNVTGATAAYSYMAPDEAIYPFITFIPTAVKMPYRGFHQDYEFISVQFNVFDDTPASYATVRILSEIERIFQKNCRGFELDPTCGMHLICTHKTNEFVNYLEKDHYWMGVIEFEFRTQKDSCCWINPDNSSSSSSVSVSYSTSSSTSSSSLSTVSESSQSTGTESSESTSSSSLSSNEYSSSSSSNSSASTSSESTSSSESSSYSSESTSTESSSSTLSESSSSNSSSSWSTESSSSTSSESSSSTSETSSSSLADSSSSSSSSPSSQSISSESLSTESSGSTSSSSLSSVQDSSSSSSNSLSSQSISSESLSTESSGSTSSQSLSSSTSSSTLIEPSSSSSSSSSTVVYSHSSASSASTSSSSSLSSSSSISESSDYLCCDVQTCIDGTCTDSWNVPWFSSFDLTGMNITNTDACKLYLTLQSVTMGGLANILIYKDSGRTQLVASVYNATQYPVPKVITLNAENGSGIGGTVTRGADTGFVNDVLMTIGCA